MNYSDRKVFDNLALEQHKGTIINKPGSKRLYLLFYYYGRRVEKTSGMPDTEQNRLKLRTWLDRQQEKIAAGTFKFAEAFPDASEAEKAWFAQREGWDFTAEPRDILIGPYLQVWQTSVVEKFASSSKKQDYKSCITSRLMPYWEDKTFHQMTAVEMMRFLETMKWGEGGNAGKLLSKKRVKTVLTVLGKVWRHALAEFRWNLPDPFIGCKDALEEWGACDETAVGDATADDDEEEQLVEVFSFAEWQRIYANLPEWYRPIALFMLLTGTIGSEVAGLRWDAIDDKYIHIKRVIVRKVVKKKTKTLYRRRKIRITRAIAAILAEVKAVSVNSDYVFTKPTGAHFHPGNFRNNVWAKALVKAGVAYRRPYVMRHTFAAYCLLLGMESLKVVSLMGHGTKKMVYEVYGAYVEGMEDDKEGIRELFGADFWK